MTVRSRSRKARFTQPQPQPSEASSWLLWVDTFALISWGVLLLKYWLTGQINLLLHPDFMWLANLAGLFLLSLGSYRVWQYGYWRRRKSARMRLMPPASVQHFSILPPGLGSIILIIVAIAGLIIKPQPFNSQVALDRGVTDTLTATRSQPQAFRASVQPEERSIIDWVRTLNVYPEPDAYAGQAVNVQGFVIHPPEMPDEYLLVSRFVLTCCAADAYPVGLAVKLPQARAAYPSDMWIDVRGEMMTETINGTRQLTIRPENIEEIPEPRNPYEY
jgi:uncharacterized repeat protein (TIGR03943 family)